MPAIINTAGGGDLNPSFGGSSPVATAIAVVRKTSLSVTVGGGAANAISAQTTYGFDQVSGEARIVCATAIGSLGDPVTVSMGAGSNVQRFSGTLVSIDDTKFPYSATLLAKGPLYAIEEFENGEQTIYSGDGLGRAGLGLAELTGSVTGATLQQIIAAVLNRVGTSPLNGSSDNPSHIYGLVADLEFTWGTYETAAAYINRICQASAGYRIFDSADGGIYLKQISAIPGGASKTFTLGTDIFGDAQASTSKIGQRSSALVEGYDELGAGAFTSNLIGTGLAPPVFRLSSTLIESNAFCSELAAFWLTQVNRKQEMLRLTTPRDDLIGPAESHAIAGAATDSMWVKSVTTEITSNGEFSQKLTYVAAGN